MAHNAVIEDLQTGETLLLWAVTSEKLQYINEISDEPIDLPGAFTNIEWAQGHHAKAIRKAFAENIEFKPLKITVKADLTGDPGASSEGAGGKGYEIEQYAKLQDFVNRVTVFAYTSYSFVESTGYHDFSQPGLRITGLGISGFVPVKGGGAVNIIGAQIEFQSIILGAGGEEWDWDEIWDSGEVSVESDDTTVVVDQDGATFSGEINEDGDVVFDVTPLSVNYTPSHNVVEKKTLPTLDVNNQTFDLDFEGTSYTFKQRKNTRNSFVTLAIKRGDTAVLEERKITYGEDLLAGVTDPILGNYHLMAYNPTGEQSTVTTDNLGKTVQLHLIKEGEDDVVVIDPDSGAVL